MALRKSLAQRDQVEALGTVRRGRDRAPAGGGARTHRSSAGRSAAASRGRFAGKNERPVERDGRIFVDGGIYNPVPFDHLAGLADIVVGIDVVGLPSGVPGEKLTTIDLMFGASQLMMQSIIEMKRHAYPPHILLRPEVHQYRVLDFLKAKEILADSQGVAEQLKRDLDAAFAFYGSA